jgi:hypothetical protein
VGYAIFDVERVFWTPGRERSIEKQTEDGVFVGVGLNYKIREKLQARIQWTTSDAADFRMNTSRLSLEYSF